jgi:hypothetical protein
MIVWGGIGDLFLNDGGRFNPAANTWVAMTTNGAPAARAFLPSVWTGNEMIVWGSYNSAGDLNDGGRYNVGANRWAPITYQHLDRE